MTYNELIEYCRNLNPEYGHWHHIIPKSVGGSDDEENLIRLSWITHWYAHKLLAEENPDNQTIVDDFKKMGTWESWLKRSYHVYIVDRSGENNSMYGKYHTEETKDLIRQKALGRTYSDEVNQRKGRPCTEEKKKHLSNILSGRKKPEGFGEQVSKRMMGHEGAAKGKHWFNNSQQELYDFDCPDGYVPGRLKRKG